LLFFVEKNLLGFQTYVLAEKLLVGLSPFAAPSVPLDPGFSSGLPAGSSARTRPPCLSGASCPRLCTCVKQSWCRLSFFVFVKLISNLLLVQTFVSQPFFSQQTFAI
jgi:hypothetical protein